jgi:hypothetical protein
MAMRIIAGALVLGLAVIGVPIALVTVPAAAVRDMETTKPAVDPDPARARCGVRMQCLQ